MTPLPFEVRGDRTRTALAEGGLTLGGGLGYLTRRFGWTVDNVLEVEIVTADGRVRRASRDEHPDLFWGIRGAGANFGVVMSFTLRLHEVGPTVYGGLIAWPFERAHEILRAYRAITIQATRELAVWLLLINAPPEPFVPQEWHGKKIWAMAVCSTGDLAHTDDVLTPIRAIGDPIVDLLAEQPYTQVQSCSRPRSLRSTISPRSTDRSSRAPGSGPASPPVFLRTRPCIQPRWLRQMV